MKVNENKIKIRIIIPNLGFYEREVQGRDGNYFITNDMGHVWWLDDMANNGVQWEFVK
ncbi:hypothetical protein AB7W67_07315 [Providencia rettgeri]|uniref:hypothetical protein n=1 Tax=Providencia sp. PROV157 TaxID=2949867 RepID=UPI0023490C42|nr:hypothetical protein [Providencia sp. PROV157]